MILVLEPFSNLSTVAFEQHRPWRDRLALGGLIAEEGGRILGVESMFDCSDLSPELGGFKPELGGFSPELSGLSLERGGLSIGVPTFLGDVPAMEKELGPVVFKLLAIVFLAEGWFFMF